MPIIPVMEERKKPAAPAYQAAEVITGAAPATLPAVSRSIAAAALVMLLLGAKPLLDWANGLPINSASDEVLWLVQGFHDALEWLGANEPFTLARQLFRLLEAWRF